MESLRIKSTFQISDLSLAIIRPIEEKIDWRDRLIGILGARGTGKTTLLLQKMKREYGLSNKAIFLSLDDIIFSSTLLVDVVSYYAARGTEAFYIDEVHKYPDWAREIKNIYDQYKKIKIVFTGSCITNIIRQNADLSRRAVQYEMPGLSFREYLEFAGIARITPLTLEEIKKDHQSIATELVRKIKPLVHFQDYLQYGYYPFFQENKDTYPIRLEQIVKMTIESDLRFMEGYDPSKSRKITQLFYILATNVPFKPNITKLSEKTGINRNTLVQYLHYLEMARLINFLSAKGPGISNLQKPDKIYLENTNLHFALSRSNADKGSIREAFFLNQLKNAGYSVSLPLKNDFLINNSDIFEIGGKNKKAVEEGIWIVQDDIEIGAMNKIPLWIFGMLY